MYFEDYQKNKILMILDNFCREYCSKDAAELFRNTLKNSVWHNEYSDNIGIFEANRNQSFKKVDE
ncbi:hypothetical protein GM418_21635 [Maribellus comscasis]|uniref:Uncharacterized protein n=1 Tax=Maribellus comscasis TaxID=2681766 RepID=A0A6I6K177_9BACT|nr:hypothetical protein [Maribellus comscasis]QGY46172.1 hypothetical protein GM418_21635 [Maribellus comscasis]